MRTGPAVPLGGYTGRMALDVQALRIVRFPAPILRTRGDDVPEITDEVRAVAQRMIELMFEAEGIGLAAPQVGLPWRMFVAHVPEAEDRPAGTDPLLATTTPMVCINPRLVEPARDMEPLEEGCLSLPGIRGEVRRPSAISIAASDLEGEAFTARAEGLLARCWQHEFDHLEGVLIIDKMTPRSRLRNRAAVRDLEAGARVP